MLLVAGISLGSLVAQEVDYDEEQYAAYQAAVNEPDLEKRQQKIVEFIEANPKLSLVKYAVQSLGQVVDAYFKQQQWREAIDAAKTLLRVEPGAAAAYGVIAEAAFQIQDFSTVAEYGEKFYETNPSPQMAYYLAIAYQQLKQDKKFAEYGKEVISNYEPNEYIGGHFQILAQLRGLATGKKNWSAAADYARKILAGFDQASLPDSWQDYISKEKPLCYAILGRQAYEVGKWNEAISRYQQVIASTSDRNLKAESYYYIGICNWRANKLDPAMEAFARGSLVNGAPHQQPCREYLETLYKSTHNGSLAGLDEYMERITRRS